MEERSQENLFDDTKRSYKPSVTEWILMIAVIMLIIFKYRYEIKQLNNDPLPKSHWRHNYTEPSVPTNGPLPADYLAQ